MVGMDTVIERDEDVAEKRGKQTAPGETWLAVRLPDWARERLQDIAKEEDRSLSNVLRRLVLEALAARDGEREQ